MARLVKTWKPLIRAVSFRTFSASTCLLKRKWEAPVEREDFRWAIPLIEKHLIEKDQRPAELQPSKLLMVWRTKTLVGRPHTEKTIMKLLKLDGRKNQITVHKNTPAVNKKLRDVQHLVKVLPVTFAEGEPNSETDPTHCLLQDDGQFTIKPSLKPLEVTTTTPQLTADQLTWHLDTETLQKHMQRQLNTFRFGSEYFKPKYVYKYNQDGKEHRYKGDTNVGADKEWF